MPEQVWARLLNWMLHDGLTPKISHSTPSPCARSIDLDLVGRLVPGSLAWPPGDWTVGGQWRLEGAPGTVLLGVGLGVWVWADPWFVRLLRRPNLPRLLWSGGSVLDGG